MKITDDHREIARQNGLDPVSVAITNKIWLSKDQALALAKDITEALIKRDQVMIERAKAYVDSAEFYVLPRERRADAMVEAIRQLGQNHDEESD